MDRDEDDLILRRIPDDDEGPNLAEELLRVILIAFVIITALKVSTIGIPYKIIIINDETPADNGTEKNATTANSGEVVIDVNMKLEKTDVKKDRKNIVKQPSCPKSYMLVILEEICSELFVKNFFCAPGDFEKETKREAAKKFQKPPRKEAKVPTIINYAVGGLLITSVGAALVELYKAKKQDNKKDNKNPPSRKCSLADLTVLKHHRKELIRRESIMEIPEDRENTKQLGFAPPPLLRRCSFPVGPNVGGVGKYGILEDNSTEVPTRRISVIDERATFIEDRKHSIIDDSRRTSIIDSRRQSAIDIRRVSLDDSPERRRHRLVHRH